MRFEYQIKTTQGQMLRICVLRRGKVGGYWAKSLNSVWNRWNFSNQPKIGGAKNPVLCHLPFRVSFLRFSSFNVIFFLVCLPLMSSSVQVVFLSVIFLLALIAYRLSSFHAIFCLVSLPLYLKKRVSVPKRRVEITLKTSVCT